MQRLPFRNRVGAGAHACALAVAVFLVAVSLADAREFPTRTLTLVVPSLAGESTDALARVVAHELAVMLGQPVLIENAGGAGGTIAAARVANAPPDGYTLLFHHIGLAAAHTLYRQRPYDTLTAFAPVGLVGHTPMLVFARPDLPPDGFRELVAFIRTQRDWITMGHAGVGTASHLCSLLFEAAIDPKLTAVAYRRTGLLLKDVLGGHIDFACDQANSVVSAVRAGRLKAYAATADSRLASLPSVPTTGEIGYAALNVPLWYALYAPAGTPESAIRMLTSALRAALKTPELVKRFKTVDVVPAKEDEAAPMALEKRLRDSIDRWAPLLKAKGQYAD
jgi:tripartite-type tricarboxylate transporter receptor subunit TctC